MNAARGFPAKARGGLASRRETTCPRLRQPTACVGAHASPPRAIPSPGLIRSSLQHAVASLEARRAAAGVGVGRAGHLVARSGSTGAFGQLSKRLEDSWRQVKGVDELTEENLKEPLKDIRRALLEADVSLPVVRKFIKGVQEEALGEFVVRGVDPDQQLVKVVHDELVKLMGSDNEGLNPGSEDDDEATQVILMMGLQGVGKTTSCGKLAKMIKGDGDKKVLLIAADTYRPAAVEQLCKLGKKIEVDVFTPTDAAEGGSPDGLKPEDVVASGIAKARAGAYRSVVVDTAGRLQVDENMMGELCRVKEISEPTDSLLVVDAMTGQEAAELARSFDEAVGLTGAVLTKTDGDSRGGACLSLKAVTGKPVKFVTNGEGMDDIEPFFPDRMASRVLGMGDVLTLVEKSMDAFKQEEVERVQARLLENKFDFNDFLKQMEMMGRMGALGQTMRLIPGMNQVSDRQMMEAERSMKEIQGIIKVMTEEERADPDMVADSEDVRARIAEESGKDIDTVNAMIAQFMQVRGQVQNLAKMMGSKDAARLEGLMGEEGLEGIKGLPTQGSMKVGRKVSKGKVLRKKTKQKMQPAKGFGAGK